MLIKVENTPMDYPWGSDYLIQDLLGIEFIGPAAEVWFGIHPKSTATTIDGRKLSEIAPELSFMVKFLAAAKPLSIQVHPNKAQAVAGFSAGKPGFQDDNHKPEIVIAVSDFLALSGFRELNDIRYEIAELAIADIRFDPWLKACSSLQGCFEYIQNSLTKSDIEALVAVTGNPLLKSLAVDYPGDIGIAMALMLNQVLLKPGEALFLPAGNVHAYLEGLAVEVMANSDNVLRAGLTTKEVHSKQLSEIVVFESLDAVVQTKQLQQGLVQYPVTTDDFMVYSLQPSATTLLADLVLPGPSIVVCVAGEIAISTSLDEREVLKSGEVCFVSNARLISVSGSGTGYLATGN